MNKVKKQFKDFWSFYRLTNYGWNTRGNLREMITPLIIIVACMFLSFIHFSNAQAYPIIFCGCMIAWYAGRSTYDRTSLLAVAPFTPAQRCVFTVFTMILNMVFFLAGVTVGSIVVILIAALLVFMFTGENAFVIESTTETLEKVPVSSVGVWLITIMGLAVLFAAFALTHIDDKKLRNGASLVFLVIFEIISLIIVNVCGFDDQRGSGVIQRFFFNSPVLYTAHSLKYPWALLTLAGVFAGAMLIAAVWFLIKRHKSTKL